MRLRIFLFAATLCLVFMIAVQAQDQAPPPTQSSSSVDNQGIRNYLLGPGDIVTEARVDSVEVQAAGNIGVATGWRTIIGRGTQGPFERRYRFTDTWMPRSGTWQMLAAHDYLVPIKK